MTAPHSLPEFVAAEEAAVAAGTVKACGYTCHLYCHGGHVCVRAAGHTTAQVHSAASHVAHDAAGQLVQWTQPCLTDAQAVAAHDAWAAQAALDRKAAAQALANNVDLATLKALLAAAPTVPAGPP